MKKVIIASFEPFGGKSRNRGRDAARLLAHEEIGGTPVELVELPVAYAALPDAIRRLLAREPDVVVLVGEANDARTLKVERLAVNVAHARIRDNAGARPIDDELVRGGAKFDICDTVTVDEAETMGLTEVLLNAIDD